MRRAFLFSCLLVVTAVVFAGFSPQTAAQEPGQGPLRDVARSGLEVGGMINGWDNEFPAGQHVAIAEREFSAVTATMYMGWAGWLSPGVENISSDGLDRVVQWADDDVEVHGHVLVYPLSNQALPWFQEAEDHEALLETYVRQIASSNAGNVDVWHVVNEAFADPGDARTDRDGLRNDYIEYQSIGSDYIEKAFDWANQEDPDAVLIINEYGAEAEGEKADALYNFVTSRRDAGVPIEGVGFQMHIAGHGGEPDYASIRRNLQRFADAGFKLYITELDVTAKISPNELPEPTPAERARQARIYEEIAKIAAEQPAVEALMLWDFVDNRSWLQPAITALGIPGTPQHVPLDSYTYPTPWSGGRSEVAVANDNYTALRAGLATESDPDPNPIGSLPSGPTWVNSKWEAGTSYLHTVGVFDGTGWQPTDDTNLERLTSQSRDWWSLQWIFEPTGNANEYLIRNRWAAEQGYLTRQGVANEFGGYDAGNDVHLAARDESWSSQLWLVEPNSDGTFRVTNQWEPNSGVLTRLGAPNGQGGFDATNRVELNSANSSWSSQQWSVATVS